MYWIYFIIFTIAVLVPDIVSQGVFFFSENNVEEIIIFLLGITGFILFVIKERQASVQKKEREESLRQLERASKDLIESYSYIGEVNRKMDILLQISLGLMDRSVLDRRKEKEIYQSIINAASFIMKAECACLKFVNNHKDRIEKESRVNECRCNFKNAELFKLDENLNVFKKENFLIITSRETIRSVKSCLLIKGYDEKEERIPNNTGIIKALASQALFIYAYMNDKK